MHQMPASGRRCSMMLVSSNSKPPASAVPMNDMTPYSRLAGTKRAEYPTTVLPSCRIFIQKSYSADRPPSSCSRVPCQVPEKRSSPAGALAATSGGGLRQPRRATRKAATTPRSADDLPASQAGPPLSRHRAHSWDNPNPPSRRRTPHGCGRQIGDGTAVEVIHRFAVRLSYGRAPELRAAGSDPGVGQGDSVKQSSAIQEARLG